jgi:hypothetical protein
MLDERTIGNYVVGPRLGRGGMSEVFAGRHRFLGDRVAVKLLHAGLAEDPRAIAGFLAEATRTRAIEHPNVVRVLDFGSEPDGCYLVMELVDGESLTARLERAGRLDDAEVRRLGAAIADGVAAAHDRGIVHRDLKPANIMLAGDAPKIVDFGIARSMDVPATVTGPRMGSLAYMAPEQLAGAPTTPAVDVWALGVTLYELACGRLPFEDFANGRTPQLFDAAPRLGARASVSPTLEAVVMQCLERDPARRPPSMRAIAAALREVDARVTEEVTPPSGEVPAGELVRVIAPVIAPPPVGPATAAPSPARRWAVPISALAATLIGIAGWQLYIGRPPADGVRRAAVEAAPVAAARSAAPQPAPAQAQQVDDPKASDPQAGDQKLVDQKAGEAGSVAASPGAPTGFTVELRTSPAGAAILLDGKRIGVTPTSVALDAPAALTIVRRGYRPARVRADKPGPLTVRLVPRARPRPDPKKPVAGETLD